ncbi:uncharacterized protein [Chelonus insularis]|uniref:uncharacterized protein n=1 Tax=Chelonus insularis TaxID=460826 RepID=UPI00158B3238|nr:uncharacterized protein LOC118066141 [Chelonus insularis]
MAFKAILLFIVCLSLAVTMIKAGERGCAEAGEYCRTGEACCSGVCMTFRARCSGPSGGLIIPPGYRPPSFIPPLAQLPNQTNCAGLGSPCHTMDCCAPYYCGSYGNQCKSP